MEKNVECINSVYLLRKFCEFEVCHGVRANRQYTNGMSNTDTDQV